MNPRQFSRSHMLAELRSGEPFDVLVVGGGITGVGVALDSAARGLRTVDGLGMLLHQAAPGFERWFGQRPDVDDEVRRIVLE